MVELERCLTHRLPADTIVTIRDALFTEAKEANLTSEGDFLVQRRKTNGGRSVRQKLVSDIQQLVCSIKSRAVVPRTFLKNGKRSKAELQVSQVRHTQSRKATIQTANSLENDSMPDVQLNGSGCRSSNGTIRCRTSSGTIRCRTSTPEKPCTKTQDTA